MSSNLYVSIAEVPYLTIFNTINLFSRKLLINKLLAASIPDYADTSGAPQPPGKVVFKINPADPDDKGMVVSQRA